jgi:hypothetical protein
MEKEKIFEKIELVRKVSPIAWQHINFGGRFDLTGYRKPIEIELLLSKLVELLT